MKITVRRELFILRTIVTVNTVLLGFVYLTGFSGSVQKQSFEEIDVGRINIVESNGQLRAVISNASRMPDPIVDGKPFATERPPGMIFYNGIGDECGGIVFGAVAKGDQYGAYGGFTFDQFRQSQAIGLIYNDHSGSRKVGLSVWDRPETSLAEFMRRREEAQSMPEGVARDAALKQLSKDYPSPTRIFVGKNTDKEATIMLYDAAGTPRIVMMVDANGEPRLDFLNAEGKVVRSIAD